MEKLFVFGDFNWLQEPEFIGELCYEKLRGSDSYAFKFDNDWLNLHAGIKLSEDINNYPGMQCKFSSTEVIERIGIKLGIYNNKGYYGKYTLHFHTISYQSP